MSDLPVRALVLYKHGVGFFLRAGTVSGTSVTLTFRSDEINDVLKSLAVFDQNGGEIRGIHYQTPMDRQARLASSSINLASGRSLRDLLRQVSGRRISLLVDTRAHHRERVSGRIIGVDEPYIRNNGDSSDAFLHMRVTILTDGGQIMIYSLTELVSVEIEDEQARHDLSYFLDTGVKEDNRRSVNVGLSEGNHDLRVYYVAPSPTWRVSYRLVGETDEGGASGSAVLQGWGLFDNRLEEDLDGVEVTLVAGQPISFIYDLYESRIPQRPEVKDDARIAAAPVEYAGQVGAGGALGDRVDELNDAAPQPAVFGRGVSNRERDARQQSGAKLGLIHQDAQHFAAHASAMPPALAREQARKLAEQTTTRDVGEFFEYKVKTPVTVKRGESALVPIIGSDVNYDRELLYNKAKLPKHPVIALRFVNNTGLTLERGPVTVTEDGEYKGEAIIPFTKPDNEVYVPYAVELGVTVTETAASEHVTFGIRFDREKQVTQDVYTIITTAYWLENRTADDKVVTIEAPVTAKYELYETDVPAVETPTERRWQVRVPAHSKQLFTRKERMRTHQYRWMSQLTHHELHTWLSNQWLDQSLFKRLSDLLDKEGQLAAWNNELKALQTEVTALYEQQEQLRANLTTLSGDAGVNGDEGALRKRMLDKLASTQDRLDAIEGRTGEINEQIVTTAAEIDALIVALQDEDAVAP